MVQYAETPQPAGVGIKEENVHIGSGMRNGQLHSVITTLFNAVGEGFIGNADASLMGTWPTGIRAAGGTWNPVMIVPMTPSVSIVAFPSLAVGFPQTVKVRIRMVGTNQFGVYQEEITPLISKVIDATSQWFVVNMSKVFATVDEVYVITGNISNVGTVSIASIGRHTIIDPLLASNFAITDHPGDATWEAARGSAIASTNLDFVGTAPNWGVGTPLRVGPFGPDMPFPTPEIIGAMGVILREHNTPTVLNTTAPLPARGQKSVAGAAPVTGCCIGRSAAGWQGYMHKFGFFSTDGTPWTTKIANINLGGSSTRAGGLATLYARAGEDDLQLSAMIRSTLGTARGANATRGYPNG